MTLFNKVEWTLFEALHLLQSFISMWGSWIIKKIYRRKKNWDPLVAV